MSYDRLPVTELLRGPVLRTPQGWVVLASAVLYASVALLAFFGGVHPSLGKTTGAVLVLCAFWPLITFLVFVRSSSPTFGASFPKAAYVAAVALCPIAYAGWLLHGA